MFHKSMDSVSEANSLSDAESFSSLISSIRSQQDLMSSEEQSLLQILEKASIETTEENIAFTKEISNLLEKLDLEPQSLPHDIKEGLQKVSLILRSEKLMDMDETIMTVARVEKKVEEKRKQREDKQLSLIYDDLSRRYRNFSKELNYLSDSVKSLGNTIDTMRDQDLQSNRTLLSTKLTDYQQTAEKLEKTLSDMEIDELYPEKILNKYEKYMEASAELNELNKVLNQYEGLPCNLLQAKILLEAKQKEYETLEQTFLQKISS